MKGGSPCTESSTTFTAGCAERSFSRVSSPPMRGMVMSRTTTSGRVLLHLLEDLAPVGGLGADAQSFLGFEQAAQALAHDAVVVGDQDGRHVTQVRAEGRR